MVSTTFWSRPDKRCQTNQPIANTARTANQGKIEGGVAVVRGAALAPDVTSSRIPVLAEIFGEASRKRIGDIALLRGKKVRKTRGIETLVALMLT